VAHLAWRVTPEDGGAPISTASALLIFDDEGRIGTAYEFDEPKTA
jgi:hypothetical protein